MIAGVKETRKQQGCRSTETLDGGWCAAVVLPELAAARRRKEGSPEGAREVVTGLDAAGMNSENEAVVARVLQIFECLRGREDMGLRE